MWAAARRARRAQPCLLPPGSSQPAAPRNPPNLPNSPNRHAPGSRQAGHVAHSLGSGKGWARCYCYLSLQNPLHVDLAPAPAHERFDSLLAAADHGHPNVVVGLAVGSVDLPCQAEVLDRAVPVLVAALQDAAVQLHLGAAPAHLRSARSGRRWAGRVSERGGGGRGGGVKDGACVRGQGEARCAGRDRLGLGGKSAHGNGIVGRDARSVQARAQAQVQAARQSTEGGGGRGDRQLSCKSEELVQPRHTASCTPVGLRQALLLAGPPPHTPPTSSP